jgi:uncharacterized protein YciI
VVAQLEHDDVGEHVCNDSTVTNAPSSFDTYSLVLLVRPPSPTAYDDERLEAIQEEHLGYLNSLREAGDLLVAGPLSDQPDERWRGICLFAKPVEEAAAIMQRDQIGRAHV